MLWLANLHKCVEDGHSLVSPLKRFSAQCVIMPLQALPSSNYQSAYEIETTPMHMCTDETQSAVTRLLKFMRNLLVD
jgi:hypothetical protein